MRHAAMTSQVFSLLFAALSAAQVANAQSSQGHHPNELVVGFRSTANSTVKNIALNKASAKLMRHLGTPRDLNVATVDMQHVSVSGSLSDALNKLKSDPSVVFVELNYLLKPVEVSNDPSYTSGTLWGMYGDDAPACGPSGTTNINGIDAEEAWSFGYTGSKSVYVGVVDEGIQVSHPDLSPNIWANPYDVADGVDNDSNGFKDDVNGWDFASDDNSVYDAGGDSHGTHVAGTIGARGGNSAGVAGVNWNVSMISAKFLGAQGGYLSDAIDAINYMRDLKVRHGLNIVALNNSWGGGFYSAALHTAILRAAKQGILFVAAAGNDGINSDFFGSYPASYTTLQGTALESAATYEAVIAVAAIDAAGGLAYFSNYGARSVDIGAPGVNVFSTLPVNSYNTYSGTSMASPHVAGAVALYASAFPNKSAREIRDALLAKAIPTSSLRGKTVTGGRLSLSGIFGSTNGPMDPTPTPPPSSTTRDVLVSSVAATNTPFVPSLFSVTIRTQNSGAQQETFAISLEGAGGLPWITKPSVTLAAGASGTTTGLWIALPGAKGTFTLTARASAVSGETNTLNNSATTTVTIR